jgi:magnesium transporter
MYRDGVLEQEDFPLADVSDCLAPSDTIVWVDLCTPTGDELHELAEELGLHELAIEDATAEHQRPKLDRYASHLFLSCPAVRVDVDTSELHEIEIDAFISRRWLITVRHTDDFDMTAVTRRWDRSPDLAKHGVSYLLYGLLDVVVDDYFDAVQAFDDFYDDIADGIFAEHPLDPGKYRHWFQMRRALVRMHRLVVPLREALTSLMRREDEVVGEELYPYYQDVYDHILRISESIDSLRELVSTIVETNLSLRDYRQNLIVKKVTSWAGIIAVPTLITGYYGMNVPFPGYGHTIGFVVSSMLLLAVSGLLYLLFKRSGWL